MTTSTDMEAEPKPPQSCDSEGQSHPLGDSGSVSGASPCSRYGDCPEGIGAELEDLGYSYHDDWWHGDSARFEWQALVVSVIQRFSANEKNPDTP